MKIRQKLASLVAAPLIAIAASGCSTEHGLNIKLLDISSGSQSAIYWPTEDRTESDKAMFEDLSDPYDKSVIGKDFWKHYQNKIGK